MRRQCEERVRPIDPSGRTPKRDGTGVAPVWIGLTATPARRRVAPDMIEKFRTIPVATASDCMSRLTAGGPRLRPYHAGTVLCGPAFTVKTRPGDNLMVHKALDIALPGDVVVVDAGGDLTNSIIGEIMVAYARGRRLGGIVINGSIRESA